MVQKKMQCVNFEYQREDVQNPFIGFVSFQHFKDERLYSDVIVQPQANMCETEDLECYPIPPHVPQNGRSEGYYPDSSVAYIRVLWKEFEPQRGVYCYEFVEQILENARAHGQTVAFRLMAHSTCARDDVPEWLKEIIPCPERPDGKRVKDSPTAPEFLQLFGEAIRRFGERFDCDPTLFSMDISVPGAWGEGHNLHLYPEEDLKKLIDVYTEVFRHTQLMGQIGLPDMIHYANQTVPVGWRGDGLGEPNHMQLRYPPRVAKVSDIWKKAPVSFESFWWLGEWQRKGWNLDEIIAFTLQCHISSFNAKSLPIPYEWRPKIDEWVSKMGYHFAIECAEFPETVEKSGKLALELHVCNHGVAPIYCMTPLRVRLSNAQGEAILESDADASAWFPGKTTVTVAPMLPKTLQCGEYTVSVGLLAQNVYPICLCCDAPRDGDYYVLGKVKIEE